MEQIIGGRLAAEALIERGVEYVFTLSGGHITPIYQYLEGSPVALFDTRHEQAAVFMAEAWARMTRKPAVAMVTAGPGFTNALSGIANARLSNAPVVLIAGCVGLESAEKLDLQDMSQLPVIAPMVKKGWVCPVAERIPEFVDLAFRTAAAGRPGPVYLELPCDVLNAAVDPAKVKRLRSRVESRPTDPAEAREILEMLRAAQSPVVVAGSGVWYADAGEALRGFVERAGIPVFTGNSGRGSISDTHPLCFAVLPGDPSRRGLLRPGERRPGPLPREPAQPLLPLRRHLPEGCKVHPGGHRGGGDRPEPLRGPGRRRRSSAPCWRS